jgi:hypothetical protein
VDLWFPAFFYSLNQANLTTVPPPAPRGEVHVDGDGKNLSCLVMLEAVHKLGNANRSSNILEHNLWTAFLLSTQIKCSFNFAIFVVFFLGILLWQSMGES